MEGTAGYGVNDAAEFLGLGPNTVRRLFDAGEIQGIRTGGGVRRIYLSSLFEWRRQHENTNEKELVNA